MLEKIRKIDWAIFIILIVFAGLSTLVVHSAVTNTKYSGLEIRNMLNYGVGFVIMIGTAFINYKLIVRLAKYIYIVGIILLVAVYFFGKVKNSASGWFSIPGTPFDLQPAELMKVCLIIALAAFLARRQGEPLRFGQDLMPAAFIAALPFALVVIQPDLGNAMIYLAIVVGMLWIGNVKYMHTLIGISLIAASVIAFLYLYPIYHDELYQWLQSRFQGGHWLDRIDTFLYPDEVDPDKSRHVKNSIRAIGSGGLNGEGYLQGNSVHFGYVPYTYTDSIFVVVGEEFGFIGSALLLLLYFLLLYRMVLISIECNDLNGSFIIIGIISMFVFQIFQNIGMSIGIMPLTGITLPFISYGGSSLILNMLCIGIALSIRIHQQKPSIYED